MLRPKNVIFDVEGMDVELQVFQLEVFAGQVNLGCMNFGAVDVVEDLIVGNCLVVRKMVDIVDAEADSEVSGVIAEKDIGRHLSMTKAYVGKATAQNRISMGNASHSEKVLE
jgi:hypothetical protein